MSKFKEEALFLEYLFKISTRGFPLKQLQKESASYFLGGNFEWCMLLSSVGAIVDIGSISDSTTLGVDLWNATSGRARPPKSLLMIKGKTD